MRRVLGSLSNVDFQSSINFNPQHSSENDHSKIQNKAKPLSQNPWICAFFSTTQNPFNSITSGLNQLKLKKFVISLCVVVAALVVFFGGKIYVNSTNQPDIITNSTKVNNEIPHGTVCEKYFGQVKEWLEESFQTKIRSAAEKLDQIEQDIEKHCPPSKKGVILETYFKMGFIYFRANMNRKFLKWLTKIENILHWNQGASLDSETIMKTFLILATWYIQQGEYLQAERALERAQEAFEDCKKGSDKDTLLYLKSWLKEVFGELNLAKYSSSTDQAGKVSFYKKAQEFYNEAINLRKKLEKFRIAGVAQCSLARLYIEAREFGKAEFLNNEGTKNIKRSTEKIYTIASCIRNDALIKLGSGQVDAAKVRFEEAISLLDEVLPQGNDLEIRYRKEFSEIFSSEL